MYLFLNKKLQILNLRSYIEEIKGEYIVYLQT